MEQVFLIFLILLLAGILFFTSIFLAKRSNKYMVIPPMSTFILSVLIFFLARSADGWDGLVYAIFGAIILASTLLASISLLVYYFYQKSRID